MWGKKFTWRCLGVDLSACWRIGRTERPSISQTLPVQREMTGLRRVLTQKPYRYSVIKPLGASFCLPSPLSQLSCLWRTSSLLELNSQPPRRRLPALSHKRSGGLWGQNSIRSPVLGWWLTEHAFKRECPWFSRQVQNVWKDEYTEHPRIDVHLFKCPLFKEQISFPLLVGLACVLNVDKRG